MSSLTNALQILELLGPRRTVLRVSEVGRELGLPKSSVSRLLRELSDAGLLAQGDHAQGYAAGPRALQLAQLYLDQHPLLRRSDEGMSRLVETFGFTGYVSKLVGPSIVLLRVRQGSYPLRYVREVGTTLPAAQTAMGRALLWGENETRVVRSASELTPGATTLAIRLVGGRPDDVPLAVAIGFPDQAIDAACEARITEGLLALRDAVRARDA